MTTETLYVRLGGSTTLQNLVDSFYDYMDKLPEAQTIRAMHPANLSESRQKLFEFMSGWTGGPQLYQEKYGHPRLRARHMPFAIDSAARDQWLLCMSKAIADHIAEPAIATKLLANLSHLADFMRNKED